MLKRLIESHQTNFHYQHSVVSLSNIGRVGLNLQAIGVEVVALKMRTAWDAPSALFGLIRQIRSTRPDVVQTWMYHADLLGGLAARVAGNRKVVWNIRSSEGTNKFLTMLVIRLCAIFSYFIPAKIICCGEKAKDAHFNLGYDKKNFEVVPNGYDLSLFTRSELIRASMREKLACKDKDLLIGVCGRYDPVKDYRNFIEAASIVANKLEKVRFVMIGRNCDSKNDTIISWLQEFNISNLFTLLGERNDVPDVMSALDIFCLSSKTEGFPNVVCEAMAMNVPCVVTRAGDAEFIIGHTGFTVPTESSADLANALLKMSNLPSYKRAELGLSARMRVEDNFSIKQVSDRYASIYSRMKNVEPASSF